MGARQRLNGLYLTGAFFVAAIMGGVSQSWVVFVIVACVLIGAMLVGGDIRPTPVTHKRHRPRRRR